MLDFSFNMKSVRSDSILAVVGFVALLGMSDFIWLFVCLFGFLVGCWPVGCLAVWSGRLSFCCVLFVLVLACFLFGLLVRIRASLCPRNMFDPQWSHLLCQDAMTWWNGEQITQQNYNKHQVHNGWLNSHCPTHCLQKCGDHLYTSSAKCSRRIAPKTSC